MPPPLKPKYTFAIAYDLVVVRQEFHAFRHCLRDKHPVKRVSVEPWKFARYLRMP